MRNPVFLFFLAALLTFVTSTAPGFQDQPKAPDKIVFKAKTGDVTYDHKKHTDREKDNCASCHPKLFPQSKAPINFKAAMHKTAEAAKSSCASCHVEKGTAFASKGNCTKCHVKAKAK
jgi:c(7)-type cytochrome triheme protein